MHVKRLIVGDHNHVKIFQNCQTSPRVIPLASEQHAEAGSIFIHENDQVQSEVATIRFRFEEQSVALSYMSYFFFVPMRSFFFCYHGEALEGPNFDWGLQKLNNVDSINDIQI